MSSLPPASSVREAVVKTNTRQLAEQRAELERRKEAGFNSVMQTITESLPRIDGKTGEVAPASAKFSTERIVTIPLGTCELKAQIMGAVRDELQLKGYSPTHGSDYFDPKALEGVRATQEAYVFVRLGWLASNPKLVPVDLGCRE